MPHSWGTKKKRRFFYVGWLLNVPATCKCISGTDLLRQVYVLPHWDRSCRSNFLLTQGQPVPVLTLYHQVATGRPVSKSLVGLDQGKIPPVKSKWELNPGLPLSRQMPLPPCQRGGEEEKDLQLDILQSWEWLRFLCMWSLNHVIGVHRKVFSCVHFCGDDLQWWQFANMCLSVCLCRITTKTHFVTVGTQRSYVTHKGIYYNKQWHNMMTYNLCTNLLKVCEWHETVGYLAISV